MKKAALIAISMLSANIAVAQEISPILRASLPTLRPHIKAENPIRDISGNILYKINLNPFVVEEYRKSPEGIELEKSIAAKVKEKLDKELTNESEASPEQLNYLNSGVVIVAQAMQRKFGIIFDDVRSSLDFVAFIAADYNTIEKIRLDDSVVAVREVDRSEVEYDRPSAGSAKNSFLSPKTSSSDTPLLGSEYRSWAHTFVGSTSTAGSMNPVYVVDGTWLFKNGSGPTLNGRLAVTSESYNIPISSSAQVNYSDWYGGRHALAVIGIINAGQNNWGTVGINPGQPVYHYTADAGLFAFATTNYLDRAINNAFSHSEASSTYPVLNLSFNNSSGSPFNALGAGGLAFRQASNRFLVTQSAGNRYTDACSWAYNYNSSAQANDAIMVVGGLNISGTRWIRPGGSPGVAEAGSNAGACVDVWAPAHEISTTTYNVDSSYNITQTQRWIESGTSFAAPITAALASRIGSNSSTRPVQREWLIRAGSPSGNVYWPSVPALSTVPSLIPYAVTGVSANPGDTYVLNDGKYSTTGHWSPMSGSGWVSVGFGGNKNVKGIRFTLRSSDASGTPTTAPGSFEVAIWQKVGGVWVNQVNQIELKQANNVPIYVSLAYPSTSEILVWGVNTTSWFAMSELEVYGQ